MPDGQCHMLLTSFLPSAAVAAMAALLAEIGPVVAAAQESATAEDPCASSTLLLHPALAHRSFTVLFRYELSDCLYLSAQNTASGLLSCCVSKCWHAAEHAGQMSCSLVSSGWHDAGQAGMQALAASQAALVGPSVRPPALCRGPPHTTLSR